MTKTKYSSKRSVLAVPGGNSKMIAKARTLDADEIFLDLEDSVALIDKSNARQNTIAEIKAGQFKSTTLAVRINDFSSEVGKLDLEKLILEASGCFDSLIFPKIESAEQIKEIHSALDYFETKINVPLGTTKIQIQIESALGLSNISEIAKTSSRIISLIFGPGDFAASIGMQVLHIGDTPLNYPGQDAYNYVLMAILIAARANNLLAIDGPFGDLTNIEGLIQKSNLSSALGFDGKWVIHPSQIAIVNNAFTPTQENFDNAARIIAYFNDASINSDPRSAFMFEGKMIDEANRKMAETVFAKGEAAGLIPSTERK